MKNSERAMEHEFWKQVRGKGFLKTQQRQALLRRILERRGLFRAEEIWFECRAEEQRLARSTIYRLLPLMVSAGMVDELESGFKYKLYSVRKPGTGVNTYVFCEDCEQMLEVKTPNLKRLQGQINERCKVELKVQSLRVTARCETLRARGQCWRRDSAGKRES